MVVILRRLAVVPKAHRFVVPRRSCPFGATAKQTLCRLRDRQFQYVGPAWPADTVAALHVRLNQPPATEWNGVQYPPYITLVNPNPAG